MNSTIPPISTDVTKEQRFVDAFAIARQALTYIGTYRTPPTPPIYRLWYHYVEGKDAVLQAEVGAALEREHLEPSQLEAISHQYFPNVDESGLQQRTGEALSLEIAALQRLLEEQSHAGSDFRQAILSSSDFLRKQGSNSLEAQSCIDDVLSSNAQMHAKLVAAELKLAASQKNIDSLRRELLESQKAMLTDNLTGIGNRRFFELLMQQALDGHPGNVDTGVREVLTLVDLDGFKEINDTQGHIAGDEVLRFVAHEMQRLARAGSVARIGGDEFGILQQLDTDEPADKLGQAVKEFFDEKKLVLQHTGKQVGKLTASVGVAILRGEDDRLSWFERADKLLYNAKKAGKNRVMSERSIR